MVLLFVALLPFVAASSLTVFRGNATASLPLRFCFSIWTLANYCEHEEKI